MKLDKFMANTNTILNWMDSLSVAQKKASKRMMTIVKLEIEAGLEEGATDTVRDDAWQTIRSNGNRAIRAEVKDSAGNLFPQASRGQGDKYLANRTIITFCINAMKTALLALPTEMQQILTHAKKPFGKGARDMQGAFNNYDEFVGQMSIEYKEVLENSIDSNRWASNKDGLIVVNNVPQLAMIDRTVDEVSEEE